MKISPNFLDKLLAQLTQFGYEVISLDRLYQILQRNENVRKKIVFTMDDGYRDIYQNALPIFEKHNAPFAIYVTTSICDHSLIFWWYAIEDLITANNVITLSNGRVFECNSFEEKVATFMKIREIVIGFTNSNLLDQLENLFSNYIVDWYSNTRDLGLTWEEVKRLSESHLVTIGGHTKNHYALSKIDFDAMAYEVTIANQHLELKIGKKIEHFCYPFGGRSEAGLREFAFIKSLGFKTATTTRRGNIYSEHKKHLESLPRIMLTENFSVADLGQIRRNRVVSL